VAERSGDGLCLEVHDDGRGLGQAPGPPVEGVGLGNTRSRLEQLFGASARLELLPRPAGGAIARLTFPLAPRAGWPEAAP
jgi:signal transduction histidine kinase